MDVSFEALIVGVFAVLPGFVSAAARAAIVPGARSSTGEWVSGSVVASLVLNALVFSGFLLAVLDLNLGRGVGSLGEPLGKLPLRLVLWYLAVLYLLALAWGVASGLLANYAPQALAHRLRLTPVSPTSNVFNDTIEKLVRTAENRKLRDDPAQRVPWLTVRRKKIAVIGRLRRGSVDFEVDAPVEVFLSPAFRVSEAGPVAWKTLQGAEHQGVYLRLLTDDLVEVFTARADWTPPLAVASSEAWGEIAEAEEEDEGGGSRDW